MYRGTTPRVKFTLPKEIFEGVFFKNIYITFAQGSAKRIVLEKEMAKNDFVLEDDLTIKIRFTQEETLLFNANRDIYIQFRILLKDNTALASNIITTNINAIIKGGVIE
jgi:hypothetical protein